MKIEIIKERENPLLKRKELTFKVVHDAATPQRQEVREKLIALLNAKKETVILDSYTSRYGIKESIGTARVYVSEARAVEVENKALIEKNLRPKEAEKKPAVEKPKEEQKEKAEKKPPEKEKAPEGKPKAEKPEEKKQPPKEAKAPEKAEKKEK